MKVLKPSKVRTEADLLKNLKTIIAKQKSGLVVCAVLLNVSRQNIEKMRVVGKFDEIRKLECLVLEYIRNEYEHVKKD